MLKNLSMILPICMVNKKEINFDKLYLLLFISAVIDSFEMSNFVNE